MAGFRHSTAPSPNADVSVQSPAARSIEAEARKLAGSRGVDGTLLLVGGCDLTHFRLRVAQSHVRADMAPSFWSHVGILCEDAAGLGLYEVALDPPAGFQEMPKTNGVQRVSVARYEDTSRFPNVALLRFPISKLGDDQAEPKGAPGPTRSQIVRGIDRVRTERGVLDIPALILPWLGFVWGAGMPTNPLVGGTGIPGAVFAEAVRRRGRRADARSFHAVELSRGDLAGCALVVCLLRRPGSAGSGRGQGDGWHRQPSNGNALARPARGCVCRAQPGGRPGSGVFEAMSRHRPPIQWRRYTRLRRRGVSASRM